MKEKFEKILIAYTQYKLTKILSGKVKNIEVDIATEDLKHWFVISYRINEKDLIYRFQIDREYLKKDYKINFFINHFLSNFKKT